MPGPTYQFADFQLDCGHFELLRNGRALRVQRKPMELLILLASREGELVSRAEIAHRLWSSEVFVDTEHGINTAIRKLRYLLRDDSEDPKFIQTVSGMGYRFIAPLVALENPATDSPAAPTLESASDTVSEPQASTPPSIQELPKRPLAVQVAVVAPFVALTVLFIVTAVGPRQIAGLLHRDPNPPITSLAVIPLDNLSGDPNQEYFADGVTDELITMLAKDSNLRITSRTSVMQYKGAHKPLGDIARALNVDAILEGSLSHANGTVHMNLQLIRADTDAHLWAESYDRADNEAVTLPDQAAREIAAKLKNPSATRSATRSINPEAHDAYLHGQYVWYQGGDREAIKEFNLAISLQPDYAAAWAGLSSAYGQGAGSSEMDPLEAMPKAEAAAVKALELDPSLAEAHLTMGISLVTYHWDFIRGDQEIRKAMELDPRSTQAFHLHAAVLAAMNRPAEGIEIQKKASDLDPITRPWALPRAYLWAKDYDAALTDALIKLKADSGVNGLNLIVSRIYKAKGMEKEAGPYLLKFLLLSSGKEAAPEIERAYHQGGYRALVAFQLDQAEKTSRTQYMSPFNKATLNAELGNREKALSFLEQSFRIHDPGVIWIQCEPEFDFLHSEPRFHALIKGLGLPPAS
ncbi:MAG TPA: winged helix-turn-helix domain-containing protein [Terracidiphilus sp.]|nr:winged helix-turn-helix domain-containing protein [Terracidiphilus sp.]